MIKNLCAGFEPVNLSLQVSRSNHLATKHLTITGAKDIRRNAYPHIVLVQKQNMIHGITFKTHDSQFMIPYHRDPNI